ncbi:zinc transporter ZntB [Rhodobacteraceae bacterium N5(2021)]|uniref:Zinc transporter ZntB n=1 Tax=Gymnodinialimonas phycosphaerae TaxID=2841589 RepID=A0A975TSC6_9RHOB|nr:zinc transporter ZntB [Gymnodinialimonas phycosphaerae]MBY4894106.1 zinc transporter ZntB [Gymnodinialimonas phycosphaerae]
MLDDAIGFVFDGTGAATAIAPDAESGPLDGPPFEWRHFRRDAPETMDRLTACGLDPYVIEALTAEETRPRCSVHGNGVVLNLRGVNLNPGAEPDDMVSVRMWLEKDRIIGVWVRPLHAVSDLVAAIDRGAAAVSVGDFVARLALRLADSAEPYIATLNERIDDSEESVLEPGAEVSRADLAGLRRSAIVLRRYLLPQRDALATFEIEDLGWLSTHDRMRLREAVERVVRLGEDLDAIRDRAQIVHDQIMDQRAERMNRQSLLLSVVAAIFLPLGLLTGLLGINVGGIPGADNPWAFAIVTLALLVIGAGLFAWVRALGFFK